MTRRLPLVAALVVALAGPGAALAQTKKELVAKVVQLQQNSIDGIARTIAAQTAQQVLQAVGPAVAQQPPERREAVAKEVEAEIKRFHGDIEPVLRDRAGKLAPSVLSPLLDEKFSEDELKQIVAWLESPAARKFSELAPTLLVNLQQKLVTDTRPAVEPKLRALEDTLRKKLGAAAPAGAASGPAKAAAKPAPKK